MAGNHNCHFYMTALTVSDKKCEKCGEIIPLDFGNALCVKHYIELQSGISDPEYQENEEVEELDLVSRVHGRFKGKGVVLPEPQREMYESIRDYMRNECVTKNVQFPKFIWKPTVVDVGCGLGIGTNILSHEADYVLGLDKNQESVEYAKQMFARHKNNVYWSPQVDFMVSDVVNEEREMMKFDFVVCLEVFEHLKNTKPLLAFLKRVWSGKGAIFISSPNRNAWAGQERATKPLNDHHVRELTLQEFRAFIEENMGDEGNALVIDAFNSRMEPAQDSDTPILMRIMPWLPPS